MLLGTFIARVSDSLLTRTLSASFSIGSLSRWACSCGLPIAASISHVMIVGADSWLGLKVRARRAADNYVALQRWLICLHNTESLFTCRCDLIDGPNPHRSCRVDQDIDALCLSFEEFLNLLRLCDVHLHSTIFVSWSSVCRYTMSYAQNPSCVPSTKP